MRSSSGGVVGFREIGAVGALWEDVVEDHRAGRAGEGMLSGHHLVEHRAERNKSLRASNSSPRACSGDMYAMVPTAVPGLVSKCAVSPMVSPVRLSSPSRSSLARAEIENFDGPALGRENVGRLDVSVHDALFVRGIQRVRELNANFQDARNGQRGVR